MVEFRFHNEAARNLSENPQCGKARSFPFEFAERRNDVARTIFVEQLPLRLLASPVNFCRLGERYPSDNQIAHFLSEVFEIALLVYNGATPIDHDRAMSGNDAVGRNTQQ